MFSRPIWKWINTAAFILMICVNALAEILPIAGATTGEISSLYPSPLTPAPISFSIWGLIYLYLAIFILMLFLFPSANTAAEALGPWFLVSCIANIAWVLTWHYRAMSAAMLFMVVLLVSLIQIEGRLRNMQNTARQRWLIRAPFGLYYGWITVAAIANASVWLLSLGFTGWGLPSQLWQTLVLIVGGAILCIGVWVNRDIPYGLAGLWGYIGIMLRQLAPETAGSRFTWSLAAIIISCAMILLAILMTAFPCIDLKPTLKHRFRSLRPSQKTTTGGNDHG